MYSVLMAVYKKDQASWFREAMNSMWNQTIPTDDFVLVCDGPLSNELNQVINEMSAAHPALHVIRLEKNSGLGVALNAGLKHCKNELVARMDSDDLSLPRRCEMEYALFEKNPNLAICSGTVQEFWENQKFGKRNLPKTHEEIIAFSRKRNPFNHPAVMFRKSAVEKAGSYDETYHLLEDYHLWIRMLKDGCEAYNLPEVLVEMRTTLNAYERRGGLKYAGEMLRFHCWIRKTGWSSWGDFMTGAIPHAAICLAPGKLKKAVYKQLRG